MMLFSVVFRTLPPAKEEEEEDPKCHIIGLKMKERDTSKDFIKIEMDLNSKREDLPC